jgi:hypothetical protein
MKECVKNTQIPVRPANIKQSAMPGSITFIYHEAIVDAITAKNAIFQFINGLNSLPVQDMIFTIKLDLFIVLRSKSVA